MTSIDLYRKFLIFYRFCIEKSRFLLIFTDGLYHAVQVIHGGKPSEARGVLQKMPKMSRKRVILGLYFGPILGDNYQFEWPSLVVWHYQLRTIDLS